MIMTMEKVTEMGAVVLPPIPVFYHRLRTELGVGERFSRKSD